jgi:K+-transporting ATPase KdpF subunit
MTWLYVLASVVSAGLLAYLVAALLYPEKFS